MNLTKKWSKKANIKNYRILHLSYGPAQLPFYLIHWYTHFVNHLPQQNLKVCK